MRPTQPSAPRVSVVMAVRDGDRWLPEAVESVLAQSESALELIVIDDGSTDRTPLLLDALSGRDRRIRVFRQPPVGLAAALNRGLAEAHAPFVARLDADDLACATRLERQAAVLEARPQIGILGSWALEIDGAGRQVGMREPPADHAALQRLLAKGNPFVHSSVMARTDLLRRLGGYRAAFEGAEDYDLWLRASEVAELANVPEPLVSYRRHPGGVSCRGGLRQAFSVRLAQRAAAARHLRQDDPADRLDGPPDWRRALGEGVFYADDVALYRWLDTAVEESAQEGPSHGAALIERAGELTHAERQLAARALLARMRSRDRSESGSARDLLLRLCRERPSAVLRAAWSLRA
jgi:glycosyltransferase involved in cell wall biosynthesis